MTHNVRILVMLLLTLMGVCQAQALDLTPQHRYAIRLVSTGRYLSLNTNYTEGNVDNATPLITTPVAFTIAPSGNRYTLQSGDLYVGFGSKGWNTGYSTQPQAVWEIQEAATPGQYYIHSSKGYLKFDRTHQFAYTDGDNASDHLWELVQAREACITCVDAEGAELSTSTAYFFGEQSTVTAPEVDGYIISGTATATAHEGDTVTFTYSPRPCTITYQYYYIDHLDASHHSEQFSVLHGQELPQPRHQCQDHTLAGVPTGIVSGDATYRIYCFVQEEQPEVVHPDIQLTYAYYYNDVLCQTGTPVTAVYGQPYPDVDANLPAGVTATKPSGRMLLDTDQTVRIDVTVNTGFSFATTYNPQTAVWYQMNVGPNHRYLQYTAGDTQMVLATEAQEQDRFFFTLVGDPWQGYAVYNRQAGQDMVLSSPMPLAGSNEGKNATPVMTALTAIPQGNNTAWDLRAKGAGFLMSRHDEQLYINRRQDIVQGQQVLSFWTSNAAANDGGSLVYLVQYTPGVETITTNPATATPQADRVYRIYNQRSAGRMMAESDDHRVITTDGKKAGDYSQMWVLCATANGDGYNLRNADSGRMLQINNKNNVATTTTDAVTIYINPKTGYYGIGTTNNGTGDRFLNTNASINTVVSWELGNDQGSGWVFEEVSADEATLQAIQQHVLDHNTYASLQNGHYYRLQNYDYSTRYLVENYAGDRSISGLTLGELPNQNAAIWQLQGDEEHGYTLQNVFTGDYISDQSNQSKVFGTTAQVSSAKLFWLQTVEGGAWDKPHYAFSRGAGTGAADRYSLHCAKSQSYSVVAWTYQNENPSYWRLEEVTLTPEDLEDIQQQLADYEQTRTELEAINADVAHLNAQLQQYFSDYACTRLRQGYDRLTDAQLTAIMQADALPMSIQEMILRVKNQTWEGDAQRNDYTRRFRIHDYEIYTDRGVWGSITGTGPFAMFCNPTGVTVRTGDVVYIYVDQPVNDPDVKVGMYLANDTENRTDTRIDLHAGINTWFCPKDGELIVDYRLENASKRWDTYPTLRVHVEGGQATGCWDATRDMNEEDWQWLSQNAFECKFLHVKGHSTLLNLLTENVRGAANCDKIMQGWDFCFDKLQELIGHDKQWNGYYRPMINPRHSYSGAPNWGGQSGSNHPSITRSYLFNLDNFTRGNVWEILHEEAHGHQGPINVAGATEISNNSLSQMVSYEWGLNYSRGENGAGHVELFNYQQGDLKGWSWVDYMRYATPYYDYSLHIGNQMLFRLYLYFKVTGIMPDFIPRLYDELRRTGGIQKDNSVASPTIWTNDYIKLARACARVSKTDLWEFFETYGMWKYYEDVMSSRDQDNEPGAAENHIRYIGDYGGYYMKMPSRNVQADVDTMNAIKAEMKAYPRKGDNIMFLEDRIEQQLVAEDAPVVKLDPSLANTEKVIYWEIGKQGELGQYTDYVDIPEASGINYTVGGRANITVKAVNTGTVSTIPGRTVTMQGDGMLGVKIYDADGQLIYIANTRTFVVPEQVGQALEDGSCTLVVAMPDMTSLPLYRGEIGDMNRDGRISIEDLTLLIKALHVTTNYEAEDVPVLRDKILEIRK